MIGISALVILLGELMFSLVALPSTFAIPPQPVTQPISVTKTYPSKQLGAQVQTNVTFRAELNGTIIFSYNNIETFRIFIPTGLTGATALLANETHIIVDVSSGTSFIQEKWKLNDQKFKLEVCWNIPAATNIGFPLTGNSTSFVKNVLPIGNLVFDWSDAAAEGYVPTLDVSTKSIVVSVPPSGCFDPVIATSPQDRVGKTANNLMWYSNGRWWAIFKNSNSQQFYYSSADGGNTWSAGAEIWRQDFNAEDMSSHFYNGTHLISGFINNDASDPWVTITSQPFSNGSLSNRVRGDVESNVGFGDVAVGGNATHFPHVLHGQSGRAYSGPKQDGSGIYTQVKNENVFGTTHNGGAIFNLTNGRLGLVGESSGLKLRIWYQGNQSFGSTITITTSLSGVLQWDCVDYGLGTKIACATIESGVLKLYKWDGNVLSASTTVAYPGGIGNRAVAITKESGTDRLIIYRIDGTTGQIKWNRTDTDQLFDRSGTIPGTTGQTSPNYLSTVRRANGTGYAPVFFRNGSSTFNLNFILFAAFATDEIYEPLREGVAAIVYRTNTGSCPTNLLNCPKYREWNTTTSTWGSEVELPTAGSPVRFSRLDSPTITSRRVVATLSDDGYLDTYICSSECTISSQWTVTNNLAQVWTTAPSGAQRPYEIAFEKTSGNLLLAYDKVSTSSTKDLFYRTLGVSNSSWSLERSFDDTTSSLTDTVYSFVRLATNVTGGNKIGIMALDQSGVDALAWIWNGDNSTVSNQIELTASAAIGTEEVIGLAFERASGNLMIVAGEGTSMRYTRFTTLWQSSALFGTWAIGTINWVTVKGNPVPSSNEIFVAASGDSSDLDSAYWSGTAWTNHAEHDATIDGHASRVFDFSWNGLNSTGTLIWGTSSGSLSYTRFTAPNTFSATGTFTETGTHLWVQLADPSDPTVTDPVFVLGATLDSAFDIGGIKWGGGSAGPSSTGDGGITSDTTVTTYEAFQIAWQPGPWHLDTSVASSSDWERQPQIAHARNTSKLVVNYIWGDGSSSSINRCAVRSSASEGSSWGAVTSIGSIAVSDANQNHSAITADANGRFWVVCSQNKTSTHSSSYIIYKSSGDGASWNAESLLTAASAAYPVTVDRPWIAADNRTSSPNKNNVYLCWTRNNETSSTSEILFKKIGPTASAEKVLYRVGKGTTSFLTGCKIATGASGEVYVTWLHVYNSTNASIELRWNELGTIDWGWGRVSNVTTLKRFPTTGCSSYAQGCLTGTGGSKFNVVNDPSIAVDMLGGVHITYADYSTSTGGDIKYTFATDCTRGSVNDVCTWSSPLVISINIDGSTNSKDQWQSVIHVSSNTSPSNPRGTIHVIALDRRGDSSNVKWRVYHYYCQPTTLTVCISTSGWSNEAVSDKQIDNAGKHNAGEYHGITNTSSREAYTVWTDSRNFATTGFDIYADWRAR